MKERAITTTVAFTVIGVTLGVFFPDRRYEILMFGILAVLAYGLLEINAGNRSLVKEAAAFDRVLAEEDPAIHVPEDLRRLERGLGWMSYEPGYFDFRVRPILKELIVHRARERLDIDLSEDLSAGVG